MSDSIGEARKVFEIEAQSILDLREKIDASFDKAVQTLLDCKGKVIVTGMGKSGLIGRKIASTLSSTGTPSIFVHPAESSHGDLGIISQGDVVIGLSYRGETEEMNPLLKYCKRKDIPVIAITGKKESSLSQGSDVTLDVSVREEACPLNLAPTASSSATLAMGDALAVATYTKRGFKPENFAEFHPGGSLGRKLLTRVKDLMHSEKDIPLVDPEKSMKEVINLMTASQVRGICGVVSPEGTLMGAITDGDLRRRLEKSINPLDDKAGDIMNGTPKIIDQNEMAERALFLMEQFDIRSLFVVDSQSKDSVRPIGLVHLQDLLKAKIR